MLSHWFAVIIYFAVIILVAVIIFFEYK